MRNIGIFGGTFNPPHLGHKYLANEVKNAVGLEKIIIMPTFVPPHKSSYMLEKSEDRLEMCNLTFFESYFSISDLEIKRMGKSYTYDTLCQLKELYPKDRLFLIIGSDMLLSFHKWYRSRDILSMCTLCVISRKDSENEEVLKNYAKATLGLSQSKNEIIILPSKPMELSSTQIRSKLANCEDVSDLIEQQTLAYIIKKGLYK